MNDPEPIYNNKLFMGSFFLVKILPMVISGFSIYLGYRLFILGVTGEASLSIESKSVSGQLLNAAPGLFFAVGGLVALIFSIFKGIKIKAGGRKPLIAENLQGEEYFEVAAEAPAEDDVEI